MCNFFRIFIQYGWAQPKHFKTSSSSEMRADAQFPSFLAQSAEEVSTLT